MRAFYVHGRGVDLYRVKGTLIVRQDTMPAIDKKTIGKKTTALEGLLHKNVLIVSKELLHYRRAKYPPTSTKNLAGIIANDVADLFPMINAPDFHYRLFDSRNNYSLADIWAWPSQLIRGHARDLQCAYVIPEDALFISAQPEVTIYNHAAFDYAVAHDSRGFIDSRTFVHPLRQTDIDLFLHGLGNFRQDISHINSYLQQPTPHPPSLGRLNRINLKPFKTTNQHSNANLPLLYRLAAYAVCGYVAWAYFTIRQIDDSINSVQDKTKKINKQVTLLVNLKSKDTTTKLAEELQNKLGQAPNPVECIDALAGALSYGTYVNHLNISYGGVEAALTSSDPAGAIKALSASSSVQSVQLKGEPQKDAQNIYRFRLSIGIRRSTPETSSAAAPPATVAPVVVPQPAPTTQTTPALSTGTERPTPSAGINKSSNPGVIFRGTKIF
ncbi:MAG: hypothetical protein HQL61_01410 [Magnetococcales bacterium]|nr:hypothetical protein [Nitrospirota bacterium]